MKKKGYELGNISYKCPIEYFNDRMFLYGFPYQYITTDLDDVHYLWSLDRDEPDEGNYILQEKSKDFVKLHDKAMKFYWKLSDELNEKQDKF